MWIKGQTFIVYVAHTNAASNVPKTPQPVCVTHMMRLLFSVFMIVGLCFIFYFSNVIIVFYRFESPAKYHIKFNAPLGIWERLWCSDYL